MAHPHALVLTSAVDFGFPGGTRLRITLKHELHAQHSLGKFRLSATNVARPILAERPGIILAPVPTTRLALFEDQADFVSHLNQGSGEAKRDETDKFRGAASIRVTKEGRLSGALPAVSAKVRQWPAAGEYRYLRFAWKKIGGQSICLQLAHDGAFGPAPGKAAKYRYHAGPGPECFGASQPVDAALPGQWTVVTRDLFADFGEFTLTGLGLAAIDGESALFDHIVLGRTQADVDAAP
jgi:hypothetical protein